MNQPIVSLSVIDAIAREVGAHRLTVAKRLLGNPLRSRVMNEAIDAAAARLGYAPLFASATSAATEGGQP